MLCRLGLGIDKDFSIRFESDSQGPDSISNSICDRIRLNSISIWFRVFQLQLCTSVLLKVPLVEQRLPCLYWLNKLGSNFCKIWPWDIIACSLNVLSCCTSCVQPYSFIPFPIFSNLKRTVPGSALLQHEKISGSGIKSPPANTWVDFDLDFFILEASVPRGNAVLQPELHSLWTLLRFSSLGQRP